MSDDRKIQIDVEVNIQKGTRKIREAQEVYQGVIK